LFESHNASNYFFAYRLINTLTIVFSCFRNLNIFFRNKMVFFMTPTIRKATGKDTDALAELLARAFDDDPVINWLVRTDKKRTQGMKRMFYTSISRLCLQHEHVLVTDDLKGGALWYPPEKLGISMLRQLSLAPRMIEAVGWTHLLRLAITLDKLGKNHPAEKYYYLQFIGVDPGNRGRGAGTALMQPILETCDREKCGAFLQNSKESNIDFYKRFGFDVIGKIIPAKGAPPLWRMWRKPVK